MIFSGTALFFLKYAITQSLRIYLTFSNISFPLDYSYILVKNWEKVSFVEAHTATIFFDLSTLEFSTSTPIKIVFTGISFGFCGTHKVAPTLQQI
jgi:hypothetical protein